MEDGERIETVRLPYENRLSVCVSSQAGCAMACQFCATGLGGFRRNLTAAEIIAQPLLAMRAGKPGEAAMAPTHIVFMGMGEPLLNVDNVLTSIELMHEEIGIPAPSHHGVHGGRHARHRAPRRSEPSGDPRGLAARAVR